MRRQKCPQQWLGSKHGLNDVKCGICHGDANNYRAQPDKNICIGCHSQQINNMPQDALVTNCSFCHKAHWYTVHKIKLYRNFYRGEKNVSKCLDSDQVRFEALAEDEQWI